MNQVLTFPQRSYRWVETSIPSEYHAEVLLAIKGARKTGQLILKMDNESELILHFTQGTVGGIVWREKVLDAR